MGAVLVIAILVAMGLVVYAVIRGLMAFANMRPDDVDENGVPKSLVTQNRMMFARVKWQALAVLLLAVLMIVAGSAG